VIKIKYGFFSGNQAKMLDSATASAAAQHFDLRQLFF